MNLCRSNNLSVAWDSEKLVKKVGRERMINPLKGSGQLRQCTGICGSWSFGENASKLACLEQNMSTYLQHDLKALISCFSYKEFE